jgi:hypothetical protein
MRTYYPAPAPGVFASEATVYVGTGASCSWAERHHGHHDCPPNLWRVTERRPALMDGMPAVLSRNFGAVVDDFGALVEVPA